MHPNSKNKGANEVELDMLMDVPLEVSVELGRTRMPIQDVLGLGVGTVLELDKAVGEPLDIFVNGRLIARGETVAVGDKFGIRITTIVADEDSPETGTGK